MKYYLFVCHPEDREPVAVLVKSCIASHAKRQAFAAARRVHGERCTAPVYVDVALQVTGALAYDCTLLPFSGVFVNLANP